jgi:hypothetical protein
MGRDIYGNYGETESKVMNSPISVLAENYVGVLFPYIHSFKTI